MKFLGGGSGYSLDNKLPDNIEHSCPDYSLYDIENKAYGFLTRGCPRACDFCIVAEKEGRKSIQVAELDEFWHGEKEICLLDPNLLACKNADDLLIKLAETKSKIEFNQGLDVRMLDDDRIMLLKKLKRSIIHFAWDNPKDTITPGKLEKVAKVKGFHRGNTVVYILSNFNSSMEEDLDRIMRVKGMGLSPYLMIYNKPEAPKLLRQMQRWCNNRYVFNSCHNFLDYFLERKRI